MKENSELGVFPVPNSTSKDSSGKSHVLGRWVLVLGPSLTMPVCILLQWGLLGINWINKWVEWALHSKLEFNLSFEYISIALGASLSSLILCYFLSPIRQRRQSFMSFLVLGLSAGGLFLGYASIPLGMLFAGIYLKFQDAYSSFDNLLLLPLLILVITPGIFVMLLPLSPLIVFCGLLIGALDTLLVWFIVPGPRQDGHSVALVGHPLNSVRSDSGHNSFPTDA